MYKVQISELKDVFISDVRALSMQNYSSRENVRIIIKRIILKFHPAPQ